MITVRPQARRTGNIQPADNRTRTDNLLITNQLLCQLSHIGMIKNRGISLDSYTETTRMGLEPTTSAVTGRRSNQLSHRALLHMHLQNYTRNIHHLFFLRPQTPPFGFSPSWLSPRPISTGQLHTLPHFHLLPIYLVVFKGSYCLSAWDISS